MNKPIANATKAANLSMLLILLLPVDACNNRRTPKSLCAAL
jgi:hypothetical protein